jgi:hypothetical protein
MAQAKRKAASTHAKRTKAPGKTRSVKDLGVQDAGKVKGGMTTVGGMTTPRAPRVPGAPREIIPCI